MRLRLIAYVCVCADFTGRPVACAQCASRTEAHCSASLRAWRFSAAHCSASLALQCASRTEAPSNGLRKYHRRGRHDGTTHSHVDFLNLIIEDYARATVVRARFLAAVLSDGAYLAHVNGAYLLHVKFCIARGPPLFIVSPISQRWPLPRLVQSPRRRPLF